jgi:hypothetical protein
MEVRTAFWVAAVPGLTVATAAAALLLINDFGAGTYDGSSSIVAGLGCAVVDAALVEGTVAGGLVFAATVVAGLGFAAV